MSAETCPQCLAVDHVKTFASDEAIIKSGTTIISPMLEALTRGYLLDDFYIVVLRVDKGGWFLVEPLVRLSFAAEIRGREYSHQSEIFYFSRSNLTDVIEEFIPLLEATLEYEEKT